MIAYVQDEETRNDLAYSLSYATEDDNSSDFSRNFMNLLTDDIMKEQLEFSKNQLTKGQTKRDPGELRRVLNEVRLLFGLVSSCERDVPTPGPAILRASTA